MPKLMDDTQETMSTMSNYDFSAVKLDELGATEYTLVTILVDISGSLFGFEKDLEEMLKKSVESCQKSPRAENLMIRVVFFNNDEIELHGFKLLENINIDDYNDTISTGATTLLFDSVYHAIEATENYGQMLLDQDYLANAIIFIITDGMDNESTYTPSSIATLINKTRQNEVLESISTVLIGMTSNDDVNTYLKAFVKDGELDEYIDMGDVSKSKLAKLAKYISRSTSSTSQALGTGNPSQSLSF